MKKIMALLVLVTIVGSLCLTGCNIVDTTSNSIDSSLMSEEEREQYIEENMVCGGRVLSKQDEDLYKVSKEDGDAAHIGEMYRLYESDSFDLYMDFASTNFCIADKRGDEVVYYHSSPNRWAGNKALGTVDYVSSLTLTAYDASNKSYEFSTNGNCVEDEEYFKIVLMEEGWIRVIYTIGNDSDKDLCPLVLRKETYTKIMLKLYELEQQAEADGDSEKAKEYKTMQDDMQQLYKGIGPEAEKNEELSYLTTVKNGKEIDYTQIYELSLEDTELYARTYPLITVTPLYVLRGAVKRQKENIRDAMNAVGFTVSDLKAEMEAVEYSGEARSVLFTIPLDIKITDDGVTFEIDSSLILAPSAQKLYTISVVPFFGADTVKTGNEYMVFPDGCGTYMELNKGLYQVTQYQRIYGTDDTFAEELLTTVSVDAPSSYLVYNRDDNGGFLAYMEQGASHTIARATNGRLGGESISPVAGYQVIYIERNFRTYTRNNQEEDDSSSKTSSSTQIGEASASGVITSKYRIDTTFKAHYILDVVKEGAEQKTYAEYAKQLRELMQENGTFPKEKLKTDSLTFYLELLGAIDKEEDVAGFPITVKGALTTYDEVLQIVNELQVEGIDGEDIVVKYKYWANGGVENTAGNEVRLLTELGSESQLKNLINTLSDKGIGFYPTVDFLYLAEDIAGDDFVLTDDVARTLDMSAARVGYRGLATGTLNEHFKVVSPAVLSRFVNSYLKSYQSKVGISTIALAGFGSKLNSDYRNNAVYTRLSSQIEQEKALTTITDAGYTVMGDGANDYVWKYATYLTNVPTGGTANMSTSYSIPFIQIVLHGYIDYCTEALNLNGDYETALLVLLETGSGVHVEWCYADDSIFASTDYYMYYFSRNYGDSFEKAVAVYKEAAALLDDVADQEIVGHTKVDANIQSPYIGDIEDYSEFTLTETDGVYMTTYENGLQIIVNYNNYNIELDTAERTVVKANSYVYREGADGEWQE